MIIDKKVSTSFQPPSGRNLFKLFVPEYFVPNRMFEYVSTYKNLFIRREERKKAIVEYLIKRINERSLFVHRQTRRWIGLFASSCKVGTILLTVPRPCHKVTLYRVFLVTRASAYFVICQSRVSARGNAKLSWQDSTEWNRLEDDPFNLAFVRQQTNSKLISLQAFLPSNNNRPFPLSKMIEIDTYIFREGRIRGGEK